MTLDRWLTDEERAIARKNGINYHTLYRRVYRLGWDIKEAITAQPGTVNHGYERKYTKWLKKAQENGINISTFYSRINLLGWECEEAATRQANEMKSDRKNWLDIANRNGIGYRTFMSRVNTHGWDLERAATTPPSNTGRRCSVKVKEEAL
ncbi:nucleoside permease [Bacillus sp. FSL R12-0074]|uniref:nucleoside permease n=1 Tax=Bacillus sp. FSL R12-0074 TaxID=2954664 RepID=UPI0030FC3710